MFCCNTLETCSIVEQTIYNDYGVVLVGVLWLGSFVKNHFLYMGVLSYIYNLWVHFSFFIFHFSCFSFSSIFRLKFFIQVFMVIYRIQHFLFLFYSSYLIFAQSWRVRWLGRGLGRECLQILDQGWLLSILKCENIWHLEENYVDKTELASNQSQYSCRQTPDLGN